MAVHEIPNKYSTLPTVDGVPCREERVALRLADGSVWALDGLMVPIGQKSISLRAAARHLKSERARMARGQPGSWRMIHPARERQTATA